MSTANPFSALLEHAHAQHAKVLTSPSLVGRSHTKKLLRLIDMNGALSSADLARATNLTTKQVWGLLKAHRAAGIVIFVHGLWSLNRDAVSKREINAAVSLLRRHGYQVIEPEFKTYEY